MRFTVGLKNFPSEERGGRRVEREGRKEKKRGEKIGENGGVSVRVVRWWLGGFGGVPVRGCVARVYVLGVVN